MRTGSPMAETTYKYKLYGEEWKVWIRPGWYTRDRIALELIDRLGETVAKITVNIPEEELKEGEIIVKTWSENEPMAEFLIANGIATDTGRRAQAGYAEAWIMKLAEGIADGAAD